MKVRWWNPRKIRQSWQKFGFLVLAAIIAHGIWALQTRAAWHREVARLKAAGEWVTPEDIPRLTITGPNFADPVLAAIRLIDEKSIDDATWRHEFIDPYRRLPLLPGAKNVLSICVDQNENALAVFDQACARKEVDWGHQYKSPLVEHYSPELREIRNVADVIASDSILCFDDGRDDRAIDRCEQLLHLADRMRVEPTPLYWFYAGGIEQLATENLMECAPEIEIGFGAGQVSRDRIESLIAYLVDESLLQQSFEQALRVQRVGEIDALQTWLKGCVRSNDGEMKIPKLARYPLLPLRYRDQLLVSRATDELLVYSRYENAP